MRVLLLLGNQVELWECTLAAMKLGAVIIPGSTLLAPGRPARPGRSRRCRRGHRPVGIDRADSTTCPVAICASRSARPSKVGCAMPTASRACNRPSPMWSPSADAAVAAVLHLGHDGVAEAGRAHAHQLPDRASVDDVLDRPAARRRAPERVEPGLGQARLVVRLRAVAGRRDDLHLQLRALRRGRDARTCCAMRK